MLFRRKVVLSVLATILVLAGAAVLFACSQTPTSVPVRTFERAQRMDVVCMQLFDPKNGFAPREPLGRTTGECTPTPANTDGNFVNQLFALVTQSTRGEIAVVDLSAGLLIDQSRATPGINFLPVGALPTDVATTPDGKMAFVASAEPNKPAIYGIPTRRLLGDTPGFPHESEPTAIGSWPVCALPQNPGALAVVPRRVAAASPGGPVTGDAGADAGGDAGAPSADLPEYELVVVLPGDRRNSAKIVTIDARPFRRGGLKRGADGKPDYASDHPSDEPATLFDGPVLEPGSLAPCPITGAIELSGESALPTSFVPGPPWEDGVKYADGGVDLTCNRPTKGAHCGVRPCCNETPSPANPDAGQDGGTGSVDSGNVAVDAGACEPVTSEDAGVLPLELGPLDPPRLVSVVRDDQMLYVADEGVPLIHVLDMSTPGAPRELPPLLASSVGEPTRAVKVKDLAISPPTRDYKRYLYAVDRIEGSIMVFDVTDPASTQRTPLRRPHPELNPFQPPDRISFSSPVVAVAFARHDVPLGPIEGRRNTSSPSGVLCNPNPQIDANPTADPGFYYRAGSTVPGQDIGPRRLRGIFGFATLANGQVLTLDVDDWDSPCRRPRDMSATTAAARGNLAVTQPSAPGDTDPYHAPTVGDLSVTSEVFFPVSSPHSLRSEVLVRDDTASGPQQPRLQGAPVVVANGVILPQLAPANGATPLLDVKFALEDPRVHINQDWSVVYEGAIPGFDGLSATLASDDNYRSLTMRQPQARFCAKGVEDYARGKERTNAIGVELAKKGASLAPRADTLMSDYVQLTEEILLPEDDYWTLGNDPAAGRQCWDDTLDTPARRQDACVRTFGSAAEQNEQRDFPIIEAYDDRLVLGRFYREPDITDATGKVVTKGRREVVYKDDSAQSGRANAAIFKLMQCCFHHQVRFKVRTGRLWSAVGNSVGGGPGVGFFSHLTTDDAGRCVASCETRETLLNGRLPTIPTGIAGLGRNSPLGMRNPMMDMRIFGAADGSEPVRDTTYTFSTRGQFRALFVGIGGASTAVNPQSMRYVDTLGQMAVVDGASQGLVLIDLRAVTVARAPYF